MWLYILQWCQQKRHLCWKLSHLGLPPCWLRAVGNCQSTLDLSTNFYVNSNSHTVLLLSRYVLYLVLFLVKSMFLLVWCNLSQYKLLASNDICTPNFIWLWNWICYNIMISLVSLYQSLSLVSVQAVSLSSYLYNVARLFIYIVS